MKKFVTAACFLAAISAAGGAEPVAPNRPEEERVRAEREAAAAREQAEKIAMENAKLELDLKTIAAEKAAKDGADTATLKTLEIERMKAMNAIRSHEAKLVELRALRATRDDAVKAAENVEPWRIEINRALDRKVSFEFTDTPFTESIEFLRNIAGVNFVIDPRATNLPISNLKVHDMKLADALGWLCKLSGLKYELRNQSVFVTVETDEGAKIEPKRDRPLPAPSGKLRVKLQNGSELEADASVFARNPDMVNSIVEQVVGVTDRRIVGLPLARDNAIRQPLFQLLRAHARADVNIEYHEELSLLLLSGKNATAVNELYKLAMLAIDAHRQFGGREKPGAMPPAPLPPPTPLPPAATPPKTPLKEAQF